MLSSHVYNWQHYVVEVMNIKLYVDVRTQAVLGEFPRFLETPYQLDTIPIYFMSAPIQC